MAAEQTSVFNVKTSDLLGIDSQLKEMQADIRSLKLDAKHLKGTVGPEDMIFLPGVLHRAKCRN